MSNKSSILDTDSSKAPSGRATPSIVGALNLSAALRENLRGVQSQATRLNELLTNGGPSTSAAQVAALFGENAEAVKVLVSGISTLNLDAPAPTK